MHTREAASAHSVQVEARAAWSARVEVRLRVAGCRRWAGQRVCAGDIALQVVGNPVLESSSSQQTIRVGAALALHKEIGVSKMAGKRASEDSLEFPARKPPRMLPRE
jgi:hypothetical protein